MATTGELRTIIEELELVDIGDAASYLGEEECDVVEELSSNHQSLLSDERLSLLCEATCR